MHRFLLLFLALPLWLTGLPRATATLEPVPVVRAVLFYSPACGHCEKSSTRTFFNLSDLPQTHRHRRNLRLSSAILMTALFWLSLKPGKMAWQTIFGS